MKCGNCDKTDGLCYTSNPPQVKCTITGKFHYYGDECDAFATAEIIIPRFGINCVICGEPAAEVDSFHAHETKVCDKCKAAVLKMRENMERDPLQPILD